MSNELGRLKRAFQRQNDVSPRENARKTAIHAAMEQFNKENLAETSKSDKGIGIGSRLRERGNKMLHAINRRRIMTFIQPHFKQMLAGGVSLAVLTFAVVNIDQIIPGSIRGIIDTPGALQEESKEADDKSLNSPLASIDLSKTGKLKLNEEATAIAQAKPDLSGAKRERDVTILADQNRGEAESYSAPSSTVKNGAAVSKTIMAAPKPVAGIVGERSQTSKKRQLQSIGDADPAPYYQDQGRDKFAGFTPNPAKLVSENPVSTFSVDVDTASYAFVRSSLNRGVLPPMDAVRVEELINYFNYSYKAPDDRAQPFSTNVSIMPTPWNTQTKLMRIGIKGFELPKSDSPRANLVFLIDTSGSMNAPDKLPLLRNSFKLLLQSLKPDDTVAIVTYAGSAGTVLMPTKVSDKNKILAALDRLNSGGSTAGAEGIRQAYRLAEQQMDTDGVNRVILATDGDFNVGITNPDELKNFVERKRNTGVTLSVLGFGQGNYNDQLMQALAQNGNGNAAYIDTLNEARKVLVEQAGATLFTIAKDVKLQLEFNPLMVSEYRLIGYETRQLKRQDFNNDKIDAGDIGAGHSVTALYEITPVGVSGRLVDELRYQPNKPATESKPATASDEYAFMKIRYKLPDSDTSRLITSPITRAVEVSSIDESPRDARFAAAVAAFGQILRGGRNTGTFSYDDVIELALQAKGEDRFGYRAEFINLVRLAKSAAAMQLDNR